MDRSEAVDALERLGLSNYEARVLIALQRLGTGTARDVHRITDVPRSQVYGAAESLQDRGLIEIQQSEPIQYQSVSLDAAKSHLRGRFERTQERAFEYLDSVHRERDDNETREDIWTVQGRDAVGSRAEQLVREAEDRVVVGVRDDSLLDRPIEDALRERAQSGVDVVVISDDERVHDRFGEDATAVSLPEDHSRENRSGRVLVVDGETILLSVLAERRQSELDQETAIWSSRTGFAAVLIQLVDGWLGDAVAV